MPVVHGCPRVHDYDVVALDGPRHDLVHVLGTNQAREAGRRGSSEHVQSAGQLHRVRLEHCDLAERPLVAGELEQGLLRPQVEVRGDLAVREIEVQQQDPIGELLGGEERQVCGDRGGAHTALGAEHRYDTPAEGIADRRTDGPRRPLGVQGDRLDSREELHRLERSGEDLVCAGLEQANPLVEVVRRSHAQHGHPRTRLGALQQREDVVVRGRFGDPVDDDQAVAGGCRDQLLRARHQGDPMAGGGERFSEALGARPVGGEDEDRELHGSLMGSTGRHWASATAEVYTGRPER